MRIVPLLSALMVTAVIYLVVLEREALLDFAHGDRSALTRIALVAAVNGAQPEDATGTETPVEAAPEPVAPAAPAAAIVLTTPSGSLRQRPITEPMLAPIWTMGPSRPAEPPAPPTMMVRPAAPRIPSLAVPSSRTLSLSATRRRWCR